MLLLQLLAELNQTVFLHLWPPVASRGVAASRAGYHGVQPKSIPGARPLDRNERRVAPQPLQRVEPARFLEKHVHHHVAVVEQEPAALRAALVVARPRRPPRAARRAPRPRWCRPAGSTGRCRRGRSRPRSTAPRGSAPPGRSPSSPGPPGRPRARRLRRTGWPSEPPGGRAAGRGCRTPPPRACGRRGSGPRGRAGAGPSPRWAGTRRAAGSARGRRTPRPPAGTKPGSPSSRITLSAAGVSGSKPIPLRGITTRRARRRDAPRLAPAQQIEKRLGSDDEVEPPPILQRGEGVHRVGRAAPA